MTGNIPYWIQRLLGLDVEPGYGMAWRIVWSSSWPNWLWWLLIAVAVCVATVPYLRWHSISHLTRRRRYTLRIIRSFAVAILLIMIGQPELQLEKTDLPIFAVVLDDSMSMTSTDRDATPDPKAKSKTEAKERIEQAQSVLLADKNRLLRKMAQRYRTDVYRLSDMEVLGGSSPNELPTLIEKIRSLEATGPTTRLGDAVTSILNRHFGTEPAGILLLTDGINTEGPDLKEAATAAKRLGVPLYTVGIGSE
ncbi:MAG: vWA domain-containing protein, partial [Planctomycetia bacterium]